MKLEGEFVFPSEEQVSDEGFSISKERIDLLTQVVRFLEQ